MFKMKKRRAQSTLEYVLLVVALVAGLVAMRYFFTRSYQSSMFDKLNEVGESFDPREGYSFEWETTGAQQVTTEEFTGEYGAGDKTTGISGGTTTTNYKREKWGEAPEQMPQN